MHFLEPTRFLNAPDLAGCKVNVPYNPGLAERPLPTPAVYIPVGVWALKQPLWSHLHKITNEPVFYMMLAPYDFAAGQRHYLGNWKGQALKISGPNCNSLRSLPFQAPKKSQFSGPTPSNGLRNGFARIQFGQTNLEIDSDMESA